MIPTHTHIAIPAAASPPPRLPCPPTSDIPPPAIPFHSPPLPPLAPRRLSASVYTYTHTLPPPSSSPSCPSNSSLSYKNSSSYGTSHFSFLRRLSPRIHQSISPLLFAAHSPPIRSVSRDLQGEQFQLVGEGARLGAAMNAAAPGAGGDGGANRNDGGNPPPQQPNVPQAPEAPADPVSSLLLELPDARISVPETVIWPSLRRG